MSAGNYISFQSSYIINSRASSISRGWHEVFRL